MQVPREQWFGDPPEETIREEELHAGQLKSLPLAEGGERKGFLYLMYADRDSAGPDVLRLAEILREGAQALDA